MNTVYLDTKNVTPKIRKEILRRLHFFVPNCEVIDLQFSDLFDGQEKTILNFGKPNIIAQLVRSKLGHYVFDVNWDTNPKEGWIWHKLAQHLTLLQPIPKVKTRFLKAVKQVKKQRKNKTYIFATGPSLAEAIKNDWSDGYKIVCNTIVRDKKLWHHIKPDFIVAGDGIYHFGFTQFADAFRKDLIKRVLETKTYFIFPSSFEVVARRELKKIEPYLIPIPVGNKTSVDYDMTKHFELPDKGNVLNLLLLPLGCSLSTQVKMWGFDGRAPKDKLFWKNSNKHTYPKLMKSLQKAHPAFYNHYVPKSNPFKYIKSVHGDDLEQTLQAAEKRGYSFESLHKSWTKTINKRYLRTKDEQS